MERKEKGMMGAGLGVTLGIPFGPAGMLLGGMIGALAGGLFGLVTGKIGADKMINQFLLFLMIFGVPPKKVVTSFSMFSNFTNMQLF